MLIIILMIICQYNNSQVDIHRRPITQQRTTSVQMRVERVDFVCPVIRKSSVYKGGLSSVRPGHMPGASIKIRILTQKLYQFIHIYVWSSPPCRFNGAYAKYALISSKLCSLKR